MSRCGFSALRRSLDLLVRPEFPLLELSHGPNRTADFVEAIDALQLGGNLLRRLRSSRQQSTTSRPGQFSPSCLAPSSYTVLLAPGEAAASGSGCSRCALLPLVADHAPSQPRPAMSSARDRPEIGSAFPRPAGCSLQVIQGAFVLQRSAFIPLPAAAFEAWGRLAATFARLGELSPKRIKSPLMLPIVHAVENNVQVEVCQVGALASVWL